MIKVYLIFIFSIFTFTLFAKTKLIVFHAGSLSVPFMKIEKAFEKENPDIDVLRVIGGSRKLARMIVDVGKYADVYASADYTLIDEMLIPKYTDKNFKFASNEIVVCYTNKSKLSNIINSKNWFKIFKIKKVKIGHSDPNLDPCGYRAIIMIKLAEKYYNFPNLYTTLKQKNKFIIRPKETDLIPLLQEGIIDYLIIYKSIAIQHQFKFLKLPDKINLSKLKYDNYYNQASVKLIGKKPGEYVIKKGKAIIYGITYLKQSKYLNLAKKFVNFVLDKNRGGKIIEECGQNFIYKISHNNLIK